MKKVMVMYRTIVQDIIEIPDEQETDLRYDDDDDTSFYRYHQAVEAIDRRLPDGSSLIGIYSPDGDTTIYYEE